MEKQIGWQVDVPRFGVGRKGAPDAPNLDSPSVRVVTAFEIPQIAASSVLQHVFS